MTRMEIFANMYSIVKSSQFTLPWLLAFLTIKATAMMIETAALFNMLLFSNTAEAALIALL